MVRFLMALALLGVVLVGYDRLMTAKVEGGEQPAESTAEPTEVVAPEQAQPVVAEVPPLREPTTAPPALQAAAPVDAEVEAALNGLRAGDAQATGAAFRLALQRGGTVGGRLLNEVERAMAAAPAAASVEMLGADNAFLHSQKGRALARQAIQKATSLPVEEAIGTLSKLLETCMKGKIEKSDAEARAVVEEAYGALKPRLMQTVLNPGHLARAKSYKVEPGDALSRIAKHFRQLGHKVDAGTIAAFNRISDPRRLQVGQILKVPVEPIRTVVEKASFLQAVYVGDVIFRLYWVGHGKDDCTPVATFLVTAKQEKPDWYTDGRVVPYGHPDNVLGDYFVKFQHASFTGFGVHGTAEPESVGTMASAGCIRMLDDDIEDYFKLVPHGTEFEIRATQARR